MHLAGFLAPAVGVGVAMALVAPWVLRGAKPARRWWWQAALNSLAAVAVLALCLALLERDGKMLSYGALIVTVALMQALGQRVWR